MGRPRAMPAALRLLLLLGVTLCGAHAEQEKFMGGVMKAVGGMAASAGAAMMGMMPGKRPVREATMVPARFSGEAPFMQHLLLTDPVAERLGLPVQGGVFGAYPEIGGTLDDPLSYKAMVAEKLLGGDDSGSRGLAQGLSPDGPLVPLPQMRQQRNQFIRNFQQMHTYNVHAPHPAVAAYGAMDLLPHGTVAWKPAGASYPPLNMANAGPAAAMWYSQSPALYRPIMHPSGSPSEADWITQKYQNGGRFVMPPMSNNWMRPTPFAVPYSAPYGTSVYNTPWHY